MASPRHQDQWIWRYVAQLAEALGYPETQETQSYKLLNDDLAAYGYREGDEITIQRTWHWPQAGRWGVLVEIVGQMVFCVAENAANRKLTDGRNKYAMCDVSLIGIATRQSKLRLVPDGDMSARRHKRPA